MPGAYTVRVRLWPGVLTAIRLITLLARLRLLPLSWAWKLGDYVSRIPPRVD